MIMDKKRFYIRHINEGILVKVTKMGQPIYDKNPFPHQYWLGTKSQAEKMLERLGHRLHDMGERIL